MKNYSLTIKERNRLKKLATYLEALPTDYRHFRMSLFFKTKPSKSVEDEMNYAKHNGGVNSCGTAACAVGHGPSAGILAPDNLIITTRWSKRVDWMGYADLFTGQDQKLFDWMFGGNWNRVDNSHRGAAARIRFVLADRPLPENVMRNTPKREWKQLYADLVVA